MSKISENFGEGVQYVRNLPQRLGSTSISKNLLTVVNAAADLPSNIGKGAMRIYNVAKERIQNREPESLHRPIRRSSQEEGVIGLKPYKPPVTMEGSTKEEFPKAANKGPSSYEQNVSTFYKDRFNDFINENKIEDAKKDLSDIIVDFNDNPNTVLLAKTAFVKALVENGHNDEAKKYVTEQFNEHREDVELSIQLKAALLPALRNPKTV